MSKKDGGKAFPQIDAIYEGEYGRKDIEVTGGMTLRDYFAAKALMGILSNAIDLERIAIDAEKNGDSVAFACSSAAYDFADAMLEARK